MNSVIEKYRTKQEAWLNGKNPWVTVDNDNPNETAKRFKRVRANELWGDPRVKYSIWNEKKDKTSK